MALGTPRSHHDELTTPENNLDKLSFTELETAYNEILRLARNTFSFTDNGARNAQGEGIYINKTEGGFRVSQITDGLAEVQTYLAQNPNTALTRVCANKEEILVAIGVMLEALGKRIIE